MRISKEFKVGLIAILTFFAFWWLFQYLKGKDIFTKGNVYYVKFDNVDGLAATKPVSINGLRVGRVESIEPIVSSNGDYTFKVKLVVDEDFIFSKKSVAEIYEPGLMSGKEVRIVLSNEKPMAQSGDVIEGKISSSLVEMMGSQVGPLKDNLEKSLIQTQSTLKAIENTLNPENQAQLSQVLRNLNGTLVSVKQTSESAQNLIASNNNKLSSTLDQTQSTIASAQNTVEKYGKVADKINNMEIEQTIAKLESTLSSLQEVMDKATKGEGTLGLMMNDPNLYNNLNTTSKNLSELIKDLKENPNRYVQISVFGKKNK